MSGRTVDCYVCGDEYPANMGRCPFCAPRKRTQTPFVEVVDETEDDE